MLRYILKRILILIPVVILISILTFALVKVMPGDPVRLALPTDITEAQYEASYDAMYQRLGLDRSLVEQYFIWITNIFRGDFGYSSTHNRPISDIIAEPMRNTLILNLGVNFLYLLIAIPVGVRCAVKRMSFFDNSWQVFSLITHSTPTFFIAILLIYIFSVTLGWFPMGGMPSSATTQGIEYILAWIQTLALPVISLTIVSLAGATRYIRNAMIEALSQDYIRTARSKGLSEKIVIYRHAFRNALIPISYIIVGTLFSLFAGSAITETVFQYHGMGTLLVDAVFGLDNNLIITLNLFYATLSLASVLVADVVYAIVDPRIKMN